MSRIEAALNDLRTYLGLSLLVLMSCGPSSVPHAPSAAPSAVATAPPKPVAATARAPTLLVLTGQAAPADAAWTPNGDVVAVSAGRLWRFEPNGDDTIVQTIPLPVQDGWRPKLSVARSADVAIASVDGKAYPFRDGKAGPPFEIAGSAGIAQLSDDGSVFVVRRSGKKGAGSGSLGSRAYDASTGKALADLPSTVQLSDGNGAFTIGNDAIHSTRDGVKVVVLPDDDHSWARTAEWIDGKAVMWGAKRLVIADPVARTMKSYPASCPVNADVRDLVDVVGKRALRMCSGRVFVVSVDGDRRELKMTPALVQLGVPDLQLPRVGSALILDFSRNLLTKGAIHELDVTTGTTRSLKSLPALRGTRGELVLTPRTSAVASPDGKLLLARSFLDSSVSILDRGTERELLRWGPPDTPPAVSNLVAFLHQEGLEIAADLQAPSGPLLTRIGPPRRSALAVPQLTADACKQQEYAPHRTIDGVEAIYQWPYGGSCVCTSKGCTTPSLAASMTTWARLGDRTLVESEGQNPELFVTEGSAPKRPLSIPGHTQAATFLDDGHAVAVVYREPSTNVQRARVIALDTLAVSGEVTVPERNIGPLQVLGTAQHLVVVQASETHVDVLVHARRSLGDVPVHIVVWPGQAVIAFADGRVELVGDAVQSAVACLAADGTLRPFATCRGRFETKSAFRLE